MNRVRNFAPGVVAGVVRWFARDKGTLGAELAVGRTREPNDEHSSPRLPPDTLRSGGGGECHR